jgi:hypothetical protein
MKKHIGGTEWKQRRTSRAMASAAKRNPQLSHVFSLLFQNLQFQSYVMHVRYFGWSD